MSHTKCQLNRAYGLGGASSHGDQVFEYWNENILAILNLHVALMPPIKFWVSAKYGLQADVA